MGAPQPVLTLTNVMLTSGTCRKVAVPDRFSDGDAALREDGVPLLACAPPDLCFARFFSPVVRARIGAPEAACLAEAHAAGA
jgi:hypothetical protein